MRNHNRFIVKFVNGTWAVFDNQQYRVATVRGLEKQAREEAARRNAQGRR